MRTVHAGDNAIIRGFWSATYDRFGNIILPGQAVAEQTIVNVRHKSIERPARRRISYEFMLESNERWIVNQCRKRERAFSL